MTAFVLQPVETQSHDARLTRLTGLLLMLLLLPGILMASGCGSDRLGHVPRSFRDYHEAGVAVIGSTYEFDATTTVKSTRPVLLTLKSNQSRRYEGRDIYPDFLALADPTERGGQGEEVEVKFSEPMVTILSGWGLLVGSSPMGKTKRVRAVGEGTTMIIEIDNTVVPAMHRVYLVGDEHSVAHISVLDPTGAWRPVDDLRPGYFGEIQDLDGASWSTIGRYVDYLQRKDFVKKVLESGAEIVP